MREVSGCGFTDAAGRYPSKRHYLPALHARRNPRRDKGTASMLDGSWHTTPQVERHQDQVTELVVSASFYPEEQKKRICGEQKAVRKWARRGRVAQVYLRADMEQEARILRAFRD